MAIGACERNDQRREILRKGMGMRRIVGMALGGAFVRGSSSGATDVDLHPPIAVIVTVAALEVAPLLSCTL